MDRLTGLQSLNLMPTENEALDMVISKKPLLFLKDSEYNAYYHLIELIASGIDPENDMYAKACVRYFNEELKEEEVLRPIIEKAYNIMTIEQKALDAKADAATPLM